MKVVLDKTLRDPLFIGLNYETVIDYFIDFTTIVGVPELFEEKMSPEIEVVNYRAALPTDFVEEIQMSIDKKMARAATDTYIDYYYEIDVKNDNQLMKDVIELTYQIKGNYIYMSKPTGALQIVYRAIKVQDDPTQEDYGYPMLPDDAVFILAFQNYIEVQYMKMLFRSGRITNQVYEEAKQSYAWAVGRYESHSKRLTLGQMESISKMFRSIVGKNNEFYTRFKNMGVR